MIQSKVKDDNGVSVPSSNDRILKTNDYKIFKRIPGNREINNRHVNKLIESMKQNDLKIPIIVNENLEIVDGQHRLEARKALKFPVYYVVINGLGLKETQNANINNKNWVPEDFLKAYVEQNYYHYKIYKEFKERYQFGHVETMIILSGESDWNMSQSFRNGEFVVENIDKANDFAEKVYSCEPYYKGFKRRSFVLALRAAIKNEKFDFDEFLNKLSYQSSKLVDCSNKEQYLKLFDDIYNYKRKLEDKLRFI